MPHALQQSIHIPIVTSTPRDRGLDGVAAEELVVPGKPRTPASAAAFPPGWWSPGAAIDPLSSTRAGRRSAANSGRIGPHGSQQHEPPWKHPPPQTPWMQTPRPYGSAGVKTSGMGASSAAGVSPTRIVPLPSNPRKGPQLPKWTKSPAVWRISQPSCVPLNRNR